MPVHLLRGAVAADGSYRLEATIPAGTAAGEHHVVVDFDGTVVELPITVEALPVAPTATAPAAADQTLAFTGTEVGGWLLPTAVVLLIAGLALAVRRRPTPVG
jgi:5'-nucleotidase